MKKKLKILFKIQKKVNIKNLEYLIFGRFYSDNYGSYNLYKLTDSALFVDRREVWHNKRFGDGYIFEGEIVSEEKFEIAKNLISQVPKDVLNNSLKGFYTVGNKNEDQLILEISDRKLKKQVTIDDYEIETEKLPVRLRDFRYLVERIIKELDK